MLYGTSDPSALLHTGEPLTVKRRIDGRGAVLTLPLPFLDPDELEVGRSDGELLVRVGAYRRALVLPDSLRRRPISSASMVDGCLEVTFGERDDGE